MATHSSILVWEISWTEEFGGTVHRVAKELDMIQPLLLLLLSHFSHVQLCVTPQTAAHQALLSLGFSRQEYWSELPLPSLATSSAAAAAESLQSCPTLCDPIDGSPPGSTIPGILKARTLEWVAISLSNA